MDYLKKAVGMMLKSVSSMTKGEMKMKKMIIGLVAIMMLVAGNVFAAATEVVTLSVTPETAASILATADTYNFGTVNLAISTNSYVAIVLSNDGDCGVTVQAEISSDFTGWDAQAADPSAAGTDVYSLYVGTAAAEVALEGFNALCNLETLSNKINVCNASDGKGGGTMLVTDTYNVWFQLDMPLNTSNSAAKSCNVTFTATAAN